MNAAPVLRSAARGEGAQQLEVLLRFAIVRELRGAGLVELEIARIDDEIDSREMSHLLELGRRAFRLHRSAPREEVGTCAPATGSSLQIRALALTTFL